VSDTLDLLAETSDGSSRWRYRRFEFTVVKEGFTWWCHQGVSIPLDVSYGAEAGYASLSRRSILRKIRRVVDRELAHHVRDSALKGRQPDARTVHARRMHA
jgi:hypothetical protein